MEGGEGFSQQIPFATTADILGDGNGSEKWVKIGRGAKLKKRKLERQHPTPYNSSADAFEFLRQLKPFVKISKVIIFNPIPLPLRFFP